MVRGIHLDSDCTTPGLVIATQGDKHLLELPGNPQEARAFVKAYLRVVDEPLEYVESESE